MAHRWLSRLIGTFTLAALAWPAHATLTVSFDVLQAQQHIRTQGVLAPTSAAFTPFSGVASSGLTNLQNIYVANSGLQTQFYGSFDADLSGFGTPYESNFMSQMLVAPGPARSQMNVSAWVYGDGRFTAEFSFMVNPFAQQGQYPNHQYSAYYKQVTLVLNGTGLQSLYGRTSFDALAAEALWGDGQVSSVRSSYNEGFYNTRYVGGVPVLNDGLQWQASGDAAIHTARQFAANAAPEPATLLLVLVAAAGLLGARPSGRPALHQK